MILTPPILKNIKKYNNIKLARGLIIDSARTRVRQGSFGVSTSDHGDTWYMLQKGKAIFKTYKSDLSDGFFDSVQKLRMVNELICYELSKQVGVLCAEYELANYKGEQGIVTYNVAKRGENLMDGYEFLHGMEPRDDMIYFYESTLEDYHDAMQLYIEDGYKIDVDKTLKTMYKIALFDCLTAQSDRHSSNIFFLVDEKKKTIRIAPLMDNEFAFNVKNFDEYVHRTMHFNEKNEDSFVKCLRFLTDQLNFQDYDEGLTSIFAQNAREIVRVAMINEEYAKIFKQILKDFKLKNAIDAVKSKGVKINPYYESYMLMAEKEIKKMIRRNIRMYKEKPATDTNYNYDYMNKASTLEN